MTYGEITSTTGNTSTGNNNIDGLLASSRWTSRDVTFSFTDNFSNDYEDESDYPNSSVHASSFESLNATQLSVARAWMQMYENVSGLNLTELTGINDRNATIRIAESDDPGTAYAYLPGGSVHDGDIWFNRTDYNNPVIGNYAYHTFGHEIGHALGLKHGHETEGVRNVAINSDRDSMEFSIMTYRSYVDDPLSDGYSNEGGGYAQSLMMHDIRAIQQMYGANFNYNSSNTTYTFSTTTGEMFINRDGQGIPGANRVFRTIWDGDGIDTYSFANYSTNLKIDLAPGGWSDLDVGGNFQRANLGDGNFARGHVFNALQFNGDTRSLIENAFGGSGHDQIYGNSAQNYLSGNGGNDKIYGEAGNDTLYGGAGSDYLDGGAGADSMFGGLNNDIYIVDDLNDRVIENANEGMDGVRSFISYTLGNNVETLLLQGAANINGSGNALDNNIIGNSGSNRLWGHDGRDVLNGLGGNDFLFGGIGDDTLLGGIGDDGLVGDVGDDILVGDIGQDILIGGAGRDTLTGGAGADKFIFTFLSDGIDTIKDFRSTEGDKIQVNGSGFRAFSLNQFAYDSNTGALFCNSTQFASLQTSLSFNPAADILLV